MSRTQIAPAGPPIRAAGGVLWRLGARPVRQSASPAAGVDVALVHRPRYDDWTLPKGKVDPGEHLAVTARREVWEETGSTGALGRRLRGQHYVVTGPGNVPADKTVEFWAMRWDAATAAAAEGVWPRRDEVDEVRWLPAPEAKTLLSRSADRETLDSFLRGPVDTTTIMLVRHGSAGNKKRWAGDDAFRPLDGRGQREAGRLAAVLPSFGPQRVISAPVTRCIATVQPLAGQLSVPVELAVEFSEIGNPDDVSPALQALEALVAAGVSSTICSQGGVIPEVVAELAERDGVDIAEPASRKGSVWVLSFDAGRLVSGDYFEDLAPSRE